MVHISLPTTKPVALTAQTHVRVVPTEVAAQLQSASPAVTSTTELPALFGIPEISVSNTADPERAILALLPRAAVNSLDRATIERGIAAGWVPSHNRARSGEPNDIGAGWLRFRAACARAERTLYGPDDQMWRYLAVVAADADAEAAARERSTERMGRRAA